MRDVALEAGVGTMTVSRALRQSTSMTGETREKVENAIRKLGYVRNSAAGTLRSNRSKIVAVIVPTISNSIFAETLQALSDILRPAGYHILIGHSGYSIAEEEALIEAFLARQPEAIVLTGYTHSPRAKTLLTAAKIPVVEIWNVSDTPIDISVGISNFDATFAMTKRLIEKKFKAIGYIGGFKENNDRTEQREAGFRAALKNAKMPWIPTRVQRSAFEFESGAAALLELLKRHPEVDVVFAASDILAVGVMLQAAKQNIRVPDDLAVVGFDDSGIAHLMSPALTTVRVPRSAIGHVAAQQILDRLSGNNLDSNTIDLGFQIIERNSG
ncbi:MAG: LacI family DNA-binding transcriptional regulator [Formivibrio sp.]|nr:LacI family DNA-binding transcriptional regulator [Formivibrio sp.]